MNIFHKHFFEEVGELIETQHTTEEENWKKYGKDICPYTGCTKKIKLYFCRSCGESKRFRIDYEL